MSKKKVKPKSVDGRLEIIYNRDARRNYEIVETLEAGISLSGNEVKSVRAGQINIKESYVRVANGQATLIGCNIAPYERARIDDCEPLREKRLLLHKREIEHLDDALRKKGLSVVPVRVYFKKGLCKIELGVGRGKKHFDKRDDVKKRDAERTMQRVLKRG